MIAETSFDLASGTFASLTNLCRYSEIDAIRSAFVPWATERQSRWGNWHDAWHAFWSDKPDSVVPGAGLPTCFLPETRSRAC